VSTAPISLMVCSFMKTRWYRSSEQRLPTAAQLFPELVDDKLDRKDNLPSCNVVEALERQEPFVNRRSPRWPDCSGVEGFPITAGSST
jgi:hypothetical protein